MTQAMMRTAAALLRAAMVRLHGQEGDEFDLRTVLSEEQDRVAVVKAACEGHGDEALLYPGDCDLWSAAYLMGALADDLDRQAEYCPN